MALSSYCSSTPKLPSLSSYWNQTRQLPNQGGSYSALGGVNTPASAPIPVPVSAPTPTPRIFSPVPTAPVTPLTPIVPVSSPVPVKSSKYINPATGTYYTPEEYANSVAKKIPVSKATGDIGQYAGSALTAPDQSVANLTNTARILNNIRNDIATGTTDPYKIGKDSGIAYSPTQLAAIEKAYAGIYDPALNDVFTRIKDRQDLDKKLVDAKSEEDKLKAQKDLIIFNTDENIRQYEATTGRKTGRATFTPTQLNSGASNAGIGIADFEQFDDDVKNFYINPPMVLDETTNKNVPKYQVFENLLKEVATGTRTPDEVIAFIKESISLPATIKQYFISRMPIAPEKKATHWYDIFLGQ